MTKITSLDLQPFFRTTVGADRLFDRIMTQIENASSSQTNYPPYNVIQSSENNYRVEVAVAGFEPGEVNVEVRDGDLIVTGERLQEVESSDEHYRVIHQGISARKFFKSWQLGEYVEVVNAQIKNGILTVNLERKVPEAAKPKTIAIDYKS